VWHLLLALAAAGGVVVLLGRDTVTGGGRLAAIAVLVFAALASLGAAAGLRARRHVGRLLSVVVNYLLFLVCFVGLLQHNGVFTGLDALGETFTRGVPFLAVAVLAFVGTGFGDGEGLSATVRRMSRLVAVVAVVGLLLAVGLVPGLLTFVRRTATPVGLLLLVGIVIGAYLTWRAMQPDVARLVGTTEHQGRTITGLLFVSPNVLGFLAFFAGPLLFSLYVSFNAWDAFADPEWIGLGNYIEMLSLDVTTVTDGRATFPEGYQELGRVGSVAFGARDVLFWTSLLNILVFSLVAIPLSVIPALFLATALNSKVPGIRLFRAIYFVPSIAGVVAVALIWKQLYDATVGWINYLLVLATDVWNALPLLPEATAPQPQWLSDANIALFSLIIVFAWQYIGFNTVLYLAGLQGIDNSLHEAAMLDGANRWQRFRNVTIPGLKETTFFVVASTGILALQLFGESVVLFSRSTPVGAGPENSTLTPVVYLYEQGFRRFDQGYASAVAWVLFVLIFVFTFIQFQRQREQVGG